MTTFEILAIGYGVAVWLSLCIVAALIARSKQRSPWGYFWLSVLLSPLVVILTVGFLPPAAEREKGVVDSNRFQRGADGKWHSI